MKKYNEKWIYLIFMFLFCFIYDTWNIIRFNTEWFPFDNIYDLYSYPLSSLEDILNFLYIPIMIIGNIFRFYRSLRCLILIICIILILGYFIYKYQLFLRIFLRKKFLLIFLIMLIFCIFILIYNVIFYTIGNMDVVKKEAFVYSGPAVQWDLNLSTKIYFRFVLISPLILMMIIINIIFDFKLKQYNRIKHILYYAIFIILIYFSINNFFEFLVKKESNKIVKLRRSTYIENLIKDAEQKLLNN